MGQRMMRAAAVGASLVLAAGVAACGDDDDEADNSSDTTVASGEPAAGDTDAFCSALVEFNGAVLSSEIDESSSEEDIVATGEMLKPMFDEVEANAPEAVADQAATLKGYIDPLVEGDASAFNSDATFEEYTSFVEDAVGECGFEEVAVTGVDYAFEGVPATMEAGTVSFAFTNDSESEEHEMIVLRKADGVDLSWAELLELPEEESMEKAEFKAAAFAPPGETGTTLAELDAGDYAMICFIPVGGGEDGPPHFTAGMIHEFTVQ